MSVSQTLALRFSSSSRGFLFLPFHIFPRINHARPLGFLTSTSHHSTMSLNQRKVGYTEQRWKEKPNSTQMSPGRESVSKVAADVVTNRLGAMSIAGNSGQIRVGLGNHVTVEGQRAVWKPKSYGTASGDTTVEVEKTPADQTAAAEKNSAVLSKLFKGNLLATFTVDNSTYSLAQIRATFYPKFENEKSDQEVRTRMIEMVSKGLATLEVSLKHSGSLFMYAGHEGGAYAKNSYGNIYTAVGVFVLGRMFREGWGTEASKKQAEFNDFLESNRMCISMELVTAVLGDHGQRPRDDYVVVTAVTELGNGKPKFYSTPDIIAFCRKWRLPTNHVWLFSTRKSVTSFFASYDALCEEGTATTVCKALDEVADISVPGSKDHIKVQGEILEGLVARMVSHESSKHMEQVSRDFPPQPVEGVDLDLGLSLREICAVNRSDEKQQIKALLESVGTSFCPDYLDWFGNCATDSHSRNADQSVLSKFLQAHPADFSTTKLQEMIRLMRERRFPAAFKCYHNFHKIGSVSSDNLFFKMVIHVHSDSAFRRYQKEMRNKPGLWPLYRGFFVDINLFKENREKAAQTAKNTNDLLKNVNNSNGTLAKDDLADEDANMMIKLKFLTYKLRTFLIRNGLSILFKLGPSAYKTYYLRQMKIWNTSPGKQKQLSKMLDEWAVYIQRKCGNKQLSSSTYLSEAEPFLEQYAKRSPENQALIGSAGSLVRAEDFMAIVEGGRDEEGDLETEREVAPSSPSASDKDTVAKNEGLIVFFPGIPGCAKSALCKEILNAPGGLGDDRPVHSLMGDLIKGKYWDKVDEQWKRKPNSIMLADKNAPNEEVWLRIEEMCRRMRASAVPVVSDSEGTETNPFSLDALAVFIYRVLHRVNHPGNLDKNSQNAGYVLLMFYNLYDGKSRKEFEGELIERFGSLVKMPLLKPDRDPLPDSVKSILEEGLNLYQLHQRRHGRPEFLDYTARTGLDMLAKHYHQAASAWVVFFVPGSDGDIGFYNEFMHYLEEKQRAAVVKLDERTTLFLVPPSEFSEKVLKVPGKLSISGVILRLEHSGSNLRSSLQHPNEKIDTNFMPYHGDTPSGPFTPLPPFPNMGKSGVSNLSFLGNLSTAASPASLSGSAHAIGSTFNPANENRHDYMLHQQNPTFVPNWSPQNLHYSNSGTGNVASQASNTTVDPAFQGCNAVMPRVVQEPSYTTGISGIPIEAKPQVSSSMLAQLASSLLGQPRQPGSGPASSIGEDFREPSTVNHSENLYRTPAQYGLQNQVHSELSASQFDQLQPLQQGSNVPAVPQREFQTGAQGNQQLQSSGAQAEDADPQKRLQATLQLAASLLQQIQQGKGT